uniref:Uncharacterized protein n=1 Tax=Cacopsylla melanoneura TaxID=428564 RepID=A0A8D8TX61_9HEMI
MFPEKPENVSFQGNYVRFQKLDAHYNINNVLFSRKLSSFSNNFKEIKQIRFGFQISMDREKIAKRCSLQYDVSFQVNYVHFQTKIMFLDKHTIKLVFKDKRIRFIFKQFRFQISIDRGKQSGLYKI